MFEVRPYVPGDETAIVALFRRVFGVEMTLDQWHWKYRHSLAHGAWPLVAEDREGKLVGHAGVIYLDGTCGGIGTPILQICDVMVEPSARGHLGSKNLYTTMIRQLFDGLATAFPDAFAYGFPGTRPYKLGEYAGVYECIERAHETAIGAARTSAWLKVERVPLVAAGLDGLWGRLRAKFDLCLVRDEAYVRWRYAEHPTIEYQRVRFLSWGRVTGWAIIRVQKQQTRVVDILCDPRKLPTLLTALAAWLTRNGYPDAVIWLPDAFRRAIPGTSHQTEVHTTNMVRGFRLATTEVRTRLYYTMGDLDIF